MEEVGGGFGGREHVGGTATVESGSGEFVDCVRE